MNKCSHRLNKIIIIIFHRTNNTNINIVVCAIRDDITDISQEDAV